MEGTSRGGEGRGRGEEFASLDTTSGHKEGFLLRKLRPPRGE